MLLNGIPGIKTSVYKKGSEAFWKGKVLGKMMDELFFWVSKRPGTI